jgi:transaldolase
MNQLEQLAQWTTVVADTGHFLELQQFSPSDATTNPSLILKAVQLPEYDYLLTEVVAQNRHQPMDVITDALLVRFGYEILQMVPGRVSTEIDARLSFDTDATVKRAQRIMAEYEQRGMAPHRILIKIAATWEGIRAAQELQKQGINCNLTLVFSFSQAVVCAQAGVTLISPFVGRIYDWHKKAAGSHWNENAMAGVADPGVQSVTQIYQYFKHFDISTEVMGASFRNVNQILALAGCDLLTISPDLLAQLQQSYQPVAPVLSVTSAKALSIQHHQYDEAGFRYALNADAMATEKLAEGIRAFAADGHKLDLLIQQKMAELDS